MPKRKPRLPRVLIIYTGGTFGMEGVGKLQIPKLSPQLLAKRMRDYVPELALLADCEVRVALNRDSAHVGPEEWVLLAQLIRESWSRFDGVVVLHGTDTLSYTAGALSLLLRPCRVPVVLTGAQKPLAAIRSDARQNLISAVEIAARGPVEIARQVTVFFDHRLFQGNRVRKKSASEFEAFESPQAPPLAVVGTTIRYREEYRVRVRPKPELAWNFSRRVLVLHVAPGAPVHELGDTVLNRLDALVLVVFPSGTAPTRDPSFMTLLSQARRKNVPVILVTEGRADAPGGAAHPATYAAGRALLDKGGLWAGEMTPEMAYVKACLLLGQKKGRLRFRKSWAMELAGEGRVD